MPLVCTKWCDVRAIRIYWVRCNTTVIARKEGFAFAVFCGKWRDIHDTPILVLPAIRLASAA